VEQTTGFAFEEEDKLLQAGHRLRADLELGALVITRGGKGATLFAHDGQAVHIPTVLVEVYDVAGAGYTAISAMTLALCSSATPVEAATIATCAGTAVCRKVGVATVTREEIQEIYLHGQS